MEGAVEALDGAVDFAGLVGVLDADEVDAAALVGDGRVDRGGVDTADVGATCPLGPKLGPSGQVARRVLLSPEGRRDHVAAGGASAWVTPEKPEASEKPRA
ncbi:hypothetical protein [Kitasatospora sp. NPDC001132]